MSIFQVEGKDAKTVDFVNYAMAPFLRMMTHFFYVSQDDDYTYKEYMDMYFVNLIQRGI